MKIFFNSLSIENFMSFEQATFQFTDSGIIKVEGSNNYKQDHSVSNGSGKSTIWEAVVWCLTGETIRGAKAVVRNGCTTGALVLLNFSCDGHEYFVQRTKDHHKYKTNLLVSKDGEDISGKGIRDTEALLQTELPDVTKDLLTSVIIFGQGMPTRFSYNTPAKRKEQLEQLTHSDFMIEDLKSRVATRKDLHSKESTKLYTDIQVNQKQHELATQKLDEIRNKLTSLDKTKLTEELSEINNSIYAVRKELDTVEKEKNELTSDTQSLQKTFESKVNEVTSKEQETKLRYLERKTTILQKTNSVAEQIHALTNEIRQLESISDICPTCKQKLPGVVKLDTTKQHEMLAELQGQKVTLEAEQNMIEHEEQDQLNNLSNDKEEINKLNLQLENQTKQLKNLQTSMDDNSKKLHNLELRKVTIETTLDNVVNEQKELSNSIVNLEREIASLESHIKNLNEATSNVNNSINILKQFETLLKRDFRGYLLSSSISFLSAAAKRYSEIVLNNDNIDIQLNGNNIDILLNGKSIENLSGGERQKVDLIVQFSLRDLLTKYFNFNTNLLVLDEIFDNLDEVGCQSILSLVNTLDVTTICIVSHRQDLSVPFDNVWTVVKNSKGISEVTTL